MEVPQPEQNRLQSLLRYRILDTPPESGYDRFTRLASQIFRTSNSSITFVDADRIWAKSNVGIEFDEIPRETALSNVVVNQCKPLVIEDALNDPLYARHPFITGWPHLRFYAGVPLRSREGFCVGVFSISDHQPRRFGRDDLDLLVSLAAQVEEELEIRRERDQYRFLFEENPHPMWIYDVESLEFLAVNRAAVAKYGYASDELLRMRITDIRPPEDVPALRQWVERLSDEQRYLREVRHLTKDGAIIYVDVSSIPAPFEGRKARLVVATDITERTLAEGARLTAEARFRTLAENAVTAVYIIQDNRFAYTNARLTELSGYTAEEMVRLSPLRLIHEEDRHSIVEKIRRQKGDEQNMRYEFRLLRKDGHLRYVEMHGRTIEHDGRPALLGALIDVTDRVLAQIALERNEARFRALVHNSAEVITLLDPDGTVQYQSPSITRILGYTPDELEGTQIFELVHPDDRNDVLRIFRELIKKSGDTTATFRFRTQDGAWRWIESTASNALHDPAVRAVVVTSRDVTDRKRTEEALRQSRLQYERLVNNLDGIIWEGTTDMRTGEVQFTFVSERLQSILGYTPESWLTDAGQWVTTLHEEDRAWAPAFCFEQTKEGNDHALEYRAIAADGRIVWLRDVVRIVDVQDDIATVAGVMIDLTETRKAQSELHSREELLRMATEAAGIGIWDWDVAGKLVRWDASTAAMFGRPDDVRHVTWEDFLNVVYVADRPAVERSIRDAFENRSHYAVDYRIPIADGSLRWITARGRVYTNASGDPIRIAGIVMDTTERKHAEAELVRARMQAEEMARLKDTFLANMSHEIRTPLTSIIGFSEVLAEDFQGEDYDLVRMIHTSGKRLLETLNSVLDLAQIESGSLRLQPGPVNLSDAVELAAELFQQQANQKGLALNIALPPHPVYVEADSGALSRILNNLISNAIKFTSEGAVTIVGGLDGTTAWVRVSDTGAGISADFLPHLFEEFRQESDGISRSHEGSGLGLTITKRLVEHMGGIIEVQSKQGHGSSFTVRLPSSAPGSTLEEKTTHLTSGSVRRPSVLVVEDQEQTQMILRHFLKDLCDLTTAYAAEEAIERARLGAFDAILIDINLSEKRTGIDVLHELRQMNHLRHVPMIACTAYALPGDREKFLGAGFDAYLAKPFRKRDVLDTLAGVLERLAE